MTRAEATEALWQWMLANWRQWGWATDIAGDYIEGKAADLGLLRLERFDPEKHDDAGWGAEPGDPWFVPVGPPRRVNTPRVGET